MNGIVTASLASAVGRIVVGSDGLPHRPRRLTAVSVACLWLVAGCGPAPGGGADDSVRQLSEIPSVAAMKAHYPEDYGRLEAKLRALPASAETAEVRAVVDGALGEVLARQRPKADDPSSVALFKVTAAEGRALRAIDVAGCASFMGSGGAPATLTKAMTPEMVAQDREASRQLLEQTALRPASPTAPLPMDRLVELSSEAAATLPEKDREVAAQVMKSGRDPVGEEQARAICDFNLALADTILARPDAGALIRGIWAIK